MANTHLDALHEVLKDTTGPIHAGRCTVCLDLRVLDFVGQCPAHCQNSSWSIVARVLENLALWNYNGDPVLLARSARMLQTLIPKETEDDSQKIG